MTKSLFEMRTRLALLHARCQRAWSHADDGEFIERLGHQSASLCRDVWSRVVVKHTAKLSRLPLSVRFPPELEGKITYDVANQRLVWLGFMTEAEFRQLIQVHPDTDYQRALAKLFEDCNRIETPFLRRLNLALTLSAAMCLIWAAIVLIEVFRSSPKQPQADSALVPSARQH